MPKCKVIVLAKILKFKPTFKAMVLVIISGNKSIVYSFGNNSGNSSQKVKVIALKKNFYRFK